MAADDALRTLREVEMEFLTGGARGSVRLRLERVKRRALRDGELAKAVAEQVGRLDLLLFKARRRSLIPLPAGLVLCVFGTAIGLLIPLLAVQLQQPSSVLLLAASFTSLWFFPHCLAHHLVGRLLGIRFHFYYVGRSLLTRLQLPVIQAIARRMPMLGIKVDYATLLRASPARRAAMYYSGPLASTLLPLYTVVYAHLYMPFGASSLAALLAAANIGFTSYYTPKVGDVKKARGASGE